MIHSLYLVVFSILALNGFCTVYQSSHDLDESSFDFVIIGGGIAGSVLASRLSEVKSFQVVLIEAGPSHEGILDTQVPFFWPRLQNTRLDWNFTSAHQVGLNGRTLAYTRGHVLGGSSSINAMFYTRGAAEDYDRWAKVTGDIGWSWKKLLSYFEKSEKFVDPAEPRNISGQYDPLVHGLTGKTFVSLPGHLQSLDKRTLNAAEELGRSFRFNEDMNSGFPLGTVWFQGTIGRGERSSAATSYLSRDVLERRNLHVVLNTRTTRILQSSSQRKTTTFSKVEIPVNGSSSPRLLEAKKEIILSAGSIGTPHILLHSGIGDTKELREIGITPILDLPSVGRNLTDHALFGLTFNANTTQTVDTISNDPTLFSQAFNQWEEKRQGVMTNGVTNNIVWLRLSNGSHELQEFEDVSAGPNTPQWELAVTNGGSPVPGGPNEFLVGTGIAVISPASRGTLTINSTNPLNPPLIDPRLLTAPADIVLARQALLSSRLFFSTRAWNGYVLSELPESMNATDNNGIDSFIRETAMSAWHPVGTAAMSNKNASWGVVDPDLKMKKCEGVRIVDASIMPFIVAAHTQAPVYAIAERAADLIKQEWL